MTIDTWEEEYAFECRRCRYGWTVEYEVRRYRGPGGRELTVRTRNGRPVRPPHLDTTCPRCGGVEVKLLPLQETTRTRGELTSRVAGP